MTLVLSVLDQSPIRMGGTTADAFAETIQLAKAADRLGFHRYWLAEHHNTRSFAGSAPEVLMARVAAETQRIRVGSGGIMLPHYSPLKVAEAFRVLETLHPGRIDLGLGRAPGGDPVTAAALQAGPKSWGIETFPQQVNLLRHYLEEAVGLAQWPADHPYKHVHAMPRGDGVPQMWMLGSTAYGGILAAELGLPFCYAHFISREDDGPDICAAYRERFKPRQDGYRPYTAVCVFVLAAGTSAEAERLAMTRNLWVMQLLANQAGGFPHPDAAQERTFSEAERTLMARIAARGIAGDKNQVKDGILAAAERYGADEFFCLTITYDFADRVKSYELIADAFRTVAA
jgi:luciferase family oxidoreductase group 1